MNQRIGLLRSRSNNRRSRSSSSPMKDWPAISSAWPASNTVQPSLARRRASARAVTVFPTPCSPTWITDRWGWRRIDVARFDRSASSAGCGRIGPSSSSEPHTKPIDSRKSRSTRVDRQLSTSVPRSCMRSLGIRRSTLSRTSAFSSSSLPAASPRVNCSPRSTRLLRNSPRKREFIANSHESSMDVNNRPTIASPGPVFASSTRSAKKRFHGA